MAKRRDFTAAPAAGKLTITGRQPEVSASADMAPSAGRITVYTKEARRHLELALRALADDDPAGIEHCKAAIKAWPKERGPGRPKLPEGETHAEQVARYAAEHGPRAAADHFGLEKATVREYVRDAGKKSQRVKIGG